MSSKLLLGALRLAAATATIATADTTPRRATPVEIPFAAVIWAAPFVCGREYPNLGVSHATASASEFMLYVSEVRRLRPGGSEGPVALTSDGTWQKDGAALLDFAARGGGTVCTNVSAASDVAPRSTVDVAGPSSRIRYVLGIFFARTHQDPTLAPHG